MANNKFTLPELQWAIAVIEGEGHKDVTKEPLELILVRINDRFTAANTTVEDIKTVLDLMNGEENFELENRRIEYGYDTD